MNIKKSANILKALSNPHRLELFLEISKSSKKDFESDGCLISEIVKCFKIGAPTISHHLKELSNAELIITEKKGKFIIAKINKKIVTEIGSLFNTNLI
jgi:ArsR family transcriptional regulator, arsenate/arsenite/antimonite-responsive transcriptional repressor